MAQAITLADAAKLSNNELVQGIVADIITVDEFYKFLPFVTFSSLAYTFSRELDEASADFAVPGTNISGSAYTGGSTTQLVNVNLACLIGDIILDGHIEDQLSDTNDQLEVQISAKAKKIGRMYANAIINARRSASLVQSNNGPIGLANRFHGMASILDAESGNAADVNHPFFNAGAATQTLQLEEDDPSSARNGRQGRVYTLEDLDDLIDRITVGSVDFLMMNSRDIRILRTLLRNTGGGTDAVQLQKQMLGADTPSLMYQGIPVFRNDYVSKADAVEVSSHTLVKASSNSTTLVVGVAGAAHQVKALMRGSDGVLYRWDVSAGAGTTSMTIASTGSFMDPEQNKMVARIAPDNAVFTNGQEVILAERLDGSSIYAGCWGEGKGVCGFTSAKSAGMHLEPVGPREDENAYQYRLKWYSGFESFSRLALARMKGCLPLGA